MLGLGLPPPAPVRGVAPTLHHHPALSAPVMGHRATDHMVIPGHLLAGEKAVLLPQPTRRKARPERSQGLHGPRHEELTRRADVEPVRDAPVEAQGPFLVDLFRECGHETVQDTVRIRVGMQGKAGQAWRLLHGDQIGPGPDQLILIRFMHNPTGLDRYNIQLCYENIFAS